MNFLPNAIFLAVLVSGVLFFAKNVGKLKRNIALGRDLEITGSKKERWNNLLMIALGQSKMVRRPVSGILHVVVYLGFIIINIEVLEIVIDGIFGSHRIFSFLGGLYGFLIGSFEIFAVLVLLAVIVFWWRRNVRRIARFLNPEMKGWPKQDANYILYFEVVLMTLFLVMNATDSSFQAMESGNTVSQFIAPWFAGFSESTIHLVERSAWWLHIVGILVFLNYLYYSKHLHILLAFPNVYFGSVTPKGQLDNMEAVTNEVKLMLDPTANPYAVPSGDTQSAPDKFGASDVQDLNWLQLLNAYSCTECGRCTSECPANQTGKLLSPRKIMMDTRDRLQEVGANIDANNGTFQDDGKQLLGDYISKEELWACTSCNACVEACPISINPLSIIMDMRRYLVMEQSAAPVELKNMMSNIENNGAPWPYNQMDRMNWANND
ncbi:MAG: (Fe-S)-binding protein [Bacteroidetes bacterium]|nr:(Fe-S)-binding protein [Bacteroidota bacterium]MDA0879097.1 (Fe-S)-binding protein [Bacteroidota bacterium]MDA1115561.1 (Fe-S)-binding protein [Bacteroidota bacterium]